MSFETAILTDQDSIAGLIPEWDELSRKDPHSTPFQLGSLTIGIGNIFAGASTPYIVAARSQNRALVGVLPLCRVLGEGRLGGHCLTSYTGWHASYFDAVVDPEVPEVGHALRAAIRARRDWDRCDCRFLRPAGNLLPISGDARTVSDGCSQFIRRQAFAERKRTSQVRPHRAARRLARFGEMVFTPAEPPDQVESVVQRFGAMHTRQWTAAGEPAEFADSLASDRLAHLLGRIAHSGLCRTGTLRLSGEIIAVHIAFRWHGIQFGWRMAHDTEWRRLSPGRLLMNLMIEEALATDCHEYDLGRGQEDYKQLWPTELRPLSRLILPGRTWRGRIAALRSRR